LLYRKGELAKVWYRTDRCFRVGEDWFIATREGDDIGPFKSRLAAERAAPKYVKILEDKVSGDYAKRILIDGIWASTLYT
jgi:hypothetical protein